MALWHPACVGCIAGLLKRTGSGRAEELLQKLWEGDEHSAALGFFMFHMLCPEMDLVADWLEKIERRHSLAGSHFRLARSGSPARAGIR